MEKRQLLNFFCLVALIGAVIGTASAYSTPESIVAASKVYVSNVSYDPATFFTGDEGTVIISVTNANTNDSAVVNHAVFGDQDIRLTSTPFDSTVHIGPLQTQKFVFSVVADAQDGTYYPPFSLTFRDADNLYYRQMLLVENRNLDLTIVDKPDAFVQGKKKTVYLQAANPRDGVVTNAVLEVSGDGITAAPARTYIGQIGPGAKIPVNVSVTPDKETQLSLVLTYDNGNNPHKVTMEVPITFGNDKKQADPVMSNIQVTSVGTTYHVTGDVNNAGLETANTVTVTALSPAVPEDPYKTYVVGALKTDDFGSFEITFTTDGKTTSVPVQVSFKDSDGNLYSSVQNVSVSPVGLNAIKDNGPPLVPIIAALVIVAIFVGGWYFYLRKKKQ